MATTDVPAQTITEVGMTPAAAVNGDNTNGNSFANSGKQWIEWTNTVASAATWTIAFPFQVKGQQLPVKTYSVAGVIGTVSKAGPFDPSVYGATVVVTPSASTLKPAVFQLG